jgi:hypothetical protein
MAPRGQAVYPRLISVTPAASQTLATDCDAGALTACCNIGPLRGPLMHTALPSRGLRVAGLASHPTQTLVPSSSAISIGTPPRRHGPHCGESQAGHHTRHVDIGKPEWDAHAEVRAANSHQTAARPVPSSDLHCTRAAHTRPSTSDACSVAIASCKSDAIISEADADDITMVRNSPIPEILDGTATVQSYKFLSEARCPPLFQDSRPSGTSLSNRGLAVTFSPLRSLIIWNGTIDIRGYR